MTKLISADSHVAVRLDAIRDRVPRSLREAFDDATAEQARIDEDLRGGRKISLDDWDLEAFRDPGYREPVARLAAMDRDGVQAEVLYSEVSAFRSFGLVKGDWKPISRAFTDHLTEFAAHDPDRLAVSYQVPIIDIEYAVAEVERLAALGARSVHLPNFPSEIGLPDYHEPVYDPLWAVLQETGISISHHLGNRHWLYDIMRRDPTPQAAIFTSMPALALAEVIAWWILTGTLERFPRLKIVLVEPGLYWVPGFLASLDRKAKVYDLPGLRLAPSEYFRRNMALTFMDDEVGLGLRHLIGIENILWSTDFPHPATTWPHSQATVARQFADIPDDERDLICARNAERIYGLA
ncbi:amidohydrolase [Frankia sp. CNm7]|uniref:Amidohydrolase n=1 Tax=Frankia nepalensis TaxID=1836974 RepID=A0A937R835_9ACTN|nr:amidohydrolase family protein [Frankia nepalensis]MBL7496683.1 amidohydrolase [Frankia nepalensis]MBL7510674.1 amidohydrolase [Frankia nepalensis]MBL7516692.1 amidohydrolase [Frankia nepalensis]MBL7627423.1 amidohydrolase [Frankia nepalensis]